MTAEQRKNAEHLLAFFERAQPKQCNMSFWLSRRPEDGPLPSMPLRGMPGCGTVGCMAGWAVSLLAPTSWDTPKDDVQALYGFPRYDSITVGRVHLDKEWADKNGIRLIKEGGYQHLVDIPQLAEHLLGKDIAKWFGEMYGPEMTLMDDRDWMIAVLRKELGMPYDQKIDAPNSPYEWEKQLHGNSWEP